MLYSAATIKKLKIQTSDGAYADIEDIYFDDISWSIRYFVADIGTWLSARLVLVSPEAIRRYSEESKTFQTNLTRQQIIDSPAFDSEKTVSRQHEENLRQFYGWSPYWFASRDIYPLAGIYMYPLYGASLSHEGGWREDQLPPTVAGDVQTRVDQDKEQEVHLRSFNEVLNYSLRAIDGDIGELDDLLIESETWRITHIIADARKWWPGGQFVIDRGLVQDISWNDRNIVVSMTRDEVKDAPPYDRDRGISHSDEIILSHYYQNFKERVHRGRISETAERFEPRAHV